MISCSNATLCESWSAHIHGNGTFYPKYQADPDISGTGVLVAFIGTGAILLCLLTIHIVLNARASAQKSAIDYWVYTAVGLLPLGLELPPHLGEFWDPIITTLILSLSDQMLLTGLSMMIAAFTLHCSISVYHAGIVLDLAWFASGAHLLTLRYLHKRLQDRSNLRNSRVVLIVLMGILLLTYTFLFGHWAAYESGPFNAQCLWDDMRRRKNVFAGEPLTIMVTNVILIFLVYTIAIIQFHEPTSDLFDRWLHAKPRQWLQKSRAGGTGPPRSGPFRRVVQVLLCIVENLHLLLVGSVKAILVSMSFAFVMSFFWFAWGVKNIFEDRQRPFREQDRFHDHDDDNNNPMEGSEDKLGFGQIVPILLLISTVLVAIEAYEERTAEWKSGRPTMESQSGADDGSRTTQHSTKNQESRLNEFFQSPVEEIDLGTRFPTRVDTEMGRGSQTSGRQLPMSPSLALRSQAGTI